MSRRAKRGQTGASSLSPPPPAENIAGGGDSTTINERKGEVRRGSIQEVARKFQQSNFHQDKAGN